MNDSMAAASDDLAQVAAGEVEARRVVVIMSDTFRRDHLAAYADPPPWARRNGREPFIETPTLDRLLAESAAFDRFYASSYPTIPCRTDLLTGRWSFPRRGWAPLRPDDLTLAEILARAGVVTEMIFDTPMLAAGDYNFHRGFTGWDFVRGQHGDAWDTSPLQPALGTPAWKLRSALGTRQYLRNTRTRRDERDWMCARTMGRAEEWLSENAAHPRFLLWVDTWDPHEPFDAPDDLLRRYVPQDYAGDRVIYPQYGRPYLDAAEIDFVRGSYAGKVAVVDRAVGRLLERIETLRLADSTLVMFMTDHGHLFGEHDLEGKPTGPLGWLYEPTIRVPFLLRHPDGLGRGTRPDAIAQHVDVLPTILDFLGVAPPPGLEGRSLLPDLDGSGPRGDGVTPREYAVSGRRNEWHGDAPAFDGAAGRPSRAEPITVSEAQFTLMCGPLGMRRLYDRDDDPGQVAEIRSAQEVRRMEEHFFDFLRATDAPETLVASYLPEPGDTSRTPGGGGDRRRALPRVDLMLVEPVPGRLLAFTSVTAARECLDRQDLVGLETASVETLLQRDERVLVYLGQQYYWLADLLEEPWSEMLRRETGSAG